ncbi:MAG: hypothetical protein KBS62_06995 [Oscillospiraceae bacterium]|nr:hypothetical protein [Candidatus Ruminococcus equi]
MTNEIDAWNTFFKTGSVLDYLEYKAIQNAKEPLNKEEENEILDDRSDSTKAEYR